MDNDYRIDLAEVARSIAGAEVVTLFFPLAFGEMPARRVHIPERYRGIIEALYQRIEAPRTIATSHRTRSDEEAPSVSKCQIMRRTRQGIALLRFASIGRDALDRVDQLTTERFAASALYLDIPLTDPRADATIDSLVEGPWYYGDS